MVLPPFGQRLTRRTIASLSGIAMAEPVTTAKRDEQMPRPLVGHGELQLNGWILSLQFRELGSHALKRRFSREPL